MLHMFNINFYMDFRTANKQTLGSLANNFCPSLPILSTFKSLLNYPQFS